MIAQLVGRRRKREDNWPHPLVIAAGIKDASIACKADENAATVLGYTIHKDPWLWPDTVRMKHGVIVGGTGAGKTTTLQLLANSSG